MTTGMIISGSRLALLVIGRVWFNCNRVFREFEFSFLNLRRVRVLLFSPRPYPDYILKIFYYYFILYFNINNNNNNRMFFNK